LTGFGVSGIGTGTGVGTTIDGSTQALLFGTPGYSIVYGGSVTEFYRSIVSSFNSGVDSVDEALRQAAQAFIDQNYPHPMQPDPVIEP